MPIESSSFLPAVSQRFDPINGVHLAGQLREHRRLVPRAGADLQNTMVRPNIQVVGHTGNHVRLGDGLSAGDGAGHDRSDARSRYSAGTNSSLGTSSMASSTRGSSIPRERICSSTMWRRARRSASGIGSCMVASPVKGQARADQHCTGADPRASTEEVASPRGQTALVRVATRPTMIGRRRAFVARQKSDSCPTRTGGTSCFAVSSHAW